MTDGHFIIAFQFSAIFFGYVSVFTILEFPQNYPHQINLLLPVIHNFQKMAKIQGILFLFDVKLSCPAKTLLNKKKGDSLWLILHQIPTS